jgi:hypothetical protein
MLRSGREMRAAAGVRAFHQLVIDEFIVDAVTNRLLNAGEHVVLLFHRSIISWGWDYSRSGQRRELWYTRTISIVEPRRR